MSEVVQLVEGMFHDLVLDEDKDGEMMEMVGDMTEKMEHVGMVEEMVGDMTE